MERDLFLWILIGLVIGTVAKLVFPAREPGGFILSLLLGIAGALAGGFVASVRRGAPLDLDFSVIAACVGAAVLLLVYRLVIQARTR